MSRTCASCERKLRRGASRRSYVLEASGDIRSGLVCGRCAIRAVALVTPPGTAVAPACKACRRRSAMFCAECMTRALEHAQELRLANVALAARGRENGGA